MARHAPLPPDTGSIVDDAGTGPPDLPDAICSSTRGLPVAGLGVWPAAQASHALKQVPKRLLDQPLIPAQHRTAGVGQLRMQLGAGLGEAVGDKRNRFSATAVQRKSGRSFFWSRARVDWRDDLSIRNCLLLDLPARLHRCRC